MSFTLELIQLKQEDICNISLGVSQIPTSAVTDLPFPQSGSTRLFNEERQENEQLAKGLEFQPAL